jgi:hypothetical protein
MAVVKRREKMHLLTWTPATTTGPPAISREAARQLENMAICANEKTLFFAEIY